MAGFSAAGLRTVLGDNQDATLVVPTSSNGIETGEAEGAPQPASAMSTGSSSSMEECIQPSPKGQDQPRGEDGVVLAPTFPRLRKDLREKLSEACPGLLDQGDAFGRKPETLQDSAAWSGHSAEEFLTSTMLAIVTGQSILLCIDPLDESGAPEPAWTPESSEDEGMGMEDEIAWHEAVLSIQNILRQTFGIQLHYRKCVRDSDLASLAEEVERERAATNVTQGSFCTVMLVEGVQHLTTAAQSLWEQRTLTTPLDVRHAPTPSQAPSAATRKDSPVLCVFLCRASASGATLASFRPSFLDRLLLSVFVRPAALSKLSAGCSDSVAAPVFTAAALRDVTSRFWEVVMEGSVLRYLEQVVTECRVHEDAACPLSPRASHALELAARGLGCFTCEFYHGLEGGTHSGTYVTPDMIAGAASTILLHRLQLKKQHRGAAGGLAWRGGGALGDVSRKRWHLVQILREIPAPM